MSISICGENLRGRLVWGWKCEGKPPHFAGMVIHKSSSHKGNIGTTKKSKMNIEFHGDRGWDYKGVVPILVEIVEAPM